MKDSGSVLDVKGLTVSFDSAVGSTTAVQDVSFEVHRGETLAIVGESGSGKSVTSLAIMQLLPTKTAYIDNGTVRYHEPTESEPIDLIALSEQGIIKYRGAKVAMIFQEPMSALNPSHKCGRQVAEMLQIHTDFANIDIKAKVLHMFEQVDLPQPDRIYDSYPHQLSGGQLQRVMIAMAIICEPDVLIADEPTTALDVTVQRHILQLLSDLKDNNGISTVFITHDLGLVRQIADRVIVMKQGEIVEQGSTDQIFEQPRQPYTKGLIACRPPLTERYTRLPVVSDFLQSDVTVQEVIEPLRETAAQYRDRQSIVASRPVLLQAEHVSKHYVTTRDFFGRAVSVVKAVDDVSFSLRQGETLGLVGESGCGKSSLAKVLLRLTEATAGTITFAGKDILSMPNADMRKLRKDYQIIFQDPYGSLNPRMTVGRAIQEPMGIHGIGGSKSDRKAMVINLLEKVGLAAGHYDRYPHQFSGGQRQRVCIARALGLQPKFILCDESVSALDVSVQAQVLNLLKDLRDEFNLSYLFISHDLSVVKHISDRIMVMQAGKIVETGDAISIIDNPQQQYTQELIAAIPH